MMTRIFDGSKRLVNRSLRLVNGAELQVPTAFIQNCPHADGPCQRAGLYYGKGGADGLGAFVVSAWDQ